MNQKQQKIRIEHIILIFSIILLSRNSWCDIPKYYKSMIYVSIFNVLYYLLCKRHLVWEFTPTGISWGGIRFVHVVIITPLLVLIFLAKLPNSLIKQVIYTIKWVVMACAIEYMANKQKLILYAHGWNIFWSGILYVKMFVYSYLFTKRPILTLFLSFYSTIFFIFKFNVPLKTKHFSRYFEPLVDLYYHTILEDLFTRKKLL